MTNRRPQTTNRAIVGALVIAGACSATGSLESDSGPASDLPPSLDTPPSPDAMLSRDVPLPLDGGSPSNTEGLDVVRPAGPPTLNTGVDPARLAADVAPEVAELVRNNPAELLSGLGFTSPTDADAIQVGRPYGIFTLHKGPWLAFDGYWRAAILVGSEYRSVVSVKLEGDKYVLTSLGGASFAATLAAREKLPAVSAALDMGRAGFLQLVGSVASPCWPMRRPCQKVPPSRTSGCNPSLGTPVKFRESTARQLPQRTLLPRSTRCSRTSSYVIDTRAEATTYPASNHRTCRFASDGSGEEARVSDAQMTKLTSQGFRGPALAMAWFILGFASDGAIPRRGLDNSAASPDL